MTNPKISVIVPIYNTESYLEKCIESILHQTYKNLEIILVDDNSDNTDYQQTIKEKYYFFNIFYESKNFYKFGYVQNNDFVVY